MVKRPFLGFFKAKFRALQGGKKTTKNKCKIERKKEEGRSLKARKLGFELKFSVLERLQGYKGW